MEKDCVEERQVFQRIGRKGAPGRVGSGKAVFLTLFAAGSFYLAFEFAGARALVIIYSTCLCLQSGLGTAPKAFRFGFLTGLLVFAPQLAWFWKIFGPVAICLWSILSMFTGAFVLALYAWRSRFGGKFFALAAAIVWTGIEFFRSELWFLKFSWLSAGFVFSERSGSFPVSTLGVYGCGFVIFLIGGVLSELRGRMRIVAGSAAVLLLFAWMNYPTEHRSSGGGKRVVVSGVQLEFPPSLEVPEYLDRLLAKFPETEIAVLSEYTFDAEIPPRVRAWCRQHHRYLIAGGKKDAGNRQYYNTAFVVNPEGNVVFEQVKSVPIQFFKDGLPASSQRVWESPWGKIGICVCYDLSYRRVTDAFARQGAQAFIVPFMDVTEWGAQQHALHARVGPMRAAEYRVPVFRLGSSGISQMIDPRGHVVAHTSFPGQEEMISGEMHLGPAAEIPWDAVFARLCTGVTGLFAVWMLLFRRAALALRAGGV